MAEMVDPRLLSYIDEPDAEWEAGLDKALILDDLKVLGKRFSKLFPDAVAQIEAMNDATFMDWRRGLKKERHQQFAGEDFMVRFGAILMPAMIVHVGMIAAKFHVPFGLAFIRLRENGSIKIASNGTATWRGDRT